MLINKMVAQFKQKGTYNKLREFIKKLNKLYNYKINLILTLTTTSVVFFYLYRLTRLLTILSEKTNIKNEWITNNVVLIFKNKKIIISMLKEMAKK